jgi:hypothetical protein
MKNFDYSHPTAAVAQTQVTQALIQAENPPSTVAGPEVAGKIKKIFGGKCFNCFWLESSNCFWRENSSCFWRENSNCFWRKT